MEVQNAQDNIDAMKLQLEQTGRFSDQEIALIGTALQADLNEASAIAAENRQIASEIRAEEAQIRAETRQEKAARQETLDSMILDIQDFVLSAGVIPSENFQKVITDVNKMFTEGKTFAEIQLAMLRAIGENKQVRDYVNIQFQKAKKSLSSGGDGSGSGGPKLSSTQIANLLAGGQEIKDIPTYTRDLTSDQAAIISTSYDPLAGYNVSTE